MSLGWKYRESMDDVRCCCNRCNRDFYTSEYTAAKYTEFEVFSDVCPECEHGDFTPYAECECCGNEYLHSELQRGLCPECYPDFYPEEPEVERRFGKIVDIMLAKAGRRTSYANQEAV
jgi:hypothetical protein